MPKKQRNQRNFRSLNLVESSIDNTYNRYKMFVSPTSSVPSKTTKKVEKFD